MVSSVQNFARTSTVIFFDRSPLATAVVTSAILANLRRQGCWPYELTLSVRSFQVPATPSTLWPDAVPRCARARPTSPSAKAVLVRRRHLEDLTESVNSMDQQPDGAGSQYRRSDGPRLANGDLSKKITVDVRGEILELKDTNQTRWSISSTPSPVK